VIGGDNQEQRDSGDQSSAQVGRRSTGEHQKGDVEFSAAELLRESRRPGAGGAQVNQHSPRPTRRPRNWSERFASSAFPPR
jgi:hypothetical protein